MAVGAEAAQGFDAMAALRQSFKEDREERERQADAGRGTLREQIARLQGSPSHE